MNLKKLMDQHRVKAGFIGGALVVSSAWGTCQFTPELPVTGDDAAEEAPVEPEAEAPPAKVEEVAAEEAEGTE